MTTINTQSQNVSGTANLSPIALGSGSLQMMFAQLQMELCQQTKSNATDYMKSIQETQDEQKKVAEFLQQARQAQSDAKDKGDTAMSQEMWEYMEDNGLASNKQAKGKDSPFEFKGSAADLEREKAQGYKGGVNCENREGWVLKDGLVKTKDGDYTDLRHSKDQWDVAIKSLQTQLDSLGTDTQTKMVYVQDFMGQYNSYLQGA
ncbi:MAG: hypothetical protein LBL69_03175, partial [Zoogloeaceae bacterium]|nr:hypothetical protein [Zoogloeaceae bacterium]